MNDDKKARRERARADLARVNQRKREKRDAAIEERLKGEVEDEEREQLLAAKRPKERTKQLADPKLLKDIEKEVKRATGMTPAQLRDALLHDPNDKRFEQLRDTYNGMALSLRRGDRRKALGSLSNRRRTMADSAADAREHRLRVRDGGGGSSLLWWLKGGKR